MPEEKNSFVVLDVKTGEPVFVIQGGEITKTSFQIELRKVVEAIVARTSFQFVLDEKRIPKVANGPWFVKGWPGTMGEGIIFFRIYCIVPTIQI